MARDDQILSARTGEKRMPMSEDHLVTLLCPQGAEQAPISHGTTAYWAFRQHGETGPWIVRVSQEAAPYLCRNAGFVPLNAAPKQ